MYLAFDSLPDSARLWVYTAPRPFQKDEIQLIEKAAPGFLQEWAAHGQGLTAGYTILENQFLVLAVDEQQHAASGCSIDASVQFIRTLEEQLGLSLTDRSLVPFWQEDAVKLVALPDLKNRIAEGTIGPESRLINTLVATKAELRDAWLLPAGRSWLKRYFKMAKA